jgi:hypothetical protein
MPLLSAAIAPAAVLREFKHTEEVGFENSAFLVGDADMPGAGDPAKEIQLRDTSGNVWPANVAVESLLGKLDYRFFRRATDPAGYCNVSNSADLSRGRTLDSPIFNDPSNEHAYLTKVPVGKFLNQPGDSVAMSFTGLSGCCYRLEWTDDMQDSELWALVSEHRTNRFWQMLSVSDTTESEDTQRFYRVAPVTD